MVSKEVRAVYHFALGLIQKTDTEVSQLLWMAILDYNSPLTEQSLAEKLKNET